MQQENECPICGADLSYYKKGARARCAGCEYDDTVKGVVRMRKFMRACAMLDKGYSIREVARMTGLAKQTVQTIKDQTAYYLGEYDEVKCGCGGKAGHRGWCWWRLQRSPKRRAFLARWHPSPAP